MRPSIWTWRRTPTSSPSFRTSLRKPWVANDVSRADIGFDSDDNEVTVYSREGQPVFFPRRSKELLSAKLIELFSAALRDREETAAATP